MKIAVKSFIGNLLSSKPIFDKNKKTAIKMNFDLKLYFEGIVQSHILFVNVNLEVAKIKFLITDRYFQ